MELTEIAYLGDLQRELDSSEYVAGPGRSVYEHSHGIDARSYNHSETVNINRTQPYDAISPEFYPDFTQITYVRGIFVFLFLLEFVISVTGNLMVCLTVYRTKAMHSPVNYYIVNLGICDFLVGIFVLPTKLFELTAEQDMSVLNNVVCTVLNFLETIVIFASVFTLVAICIERYYAVVYPVHSRIYLTNSRIGRVLAVVWIIPIIVASPSLIYPATAEAHNLFSEYGSITRVTCMDGLTDAFRKWYFIFIFCAMYILPQIFIAATCFSIFRALMKKIPVQPHRDPRAILMEKGRRKVAKMVLVIVFAFFTCWSPYFMVTIVTQLQTENFLQKGHFFFTMLCINLFGFTNSCINPIIYFAMSTRFRKGFKGILTSIWQCTKKARFSPGTSSTSLRRHSQRVLNGLGNLQRQTSGSPSPITPNESTGTSSLPTSRESKIPAKPNNSAEFPNLCYPQMPSPADPID